MWKNTAKILIIGVAICVLFSGTLSLAGYKAAKITYTISGSVGISGVVMNGLPGNPVTDKDGNYTATVDYGFSGTVTPMKESYTFGPASRRYESVTANRTNQVYTATLLTFTISGSAGMSGVVLEGLPGEPVTDANGSYSATVDYGWSGTVTPTKAGFAFKPASRIFHSVAKDQVCNYTVEKLCFIISGSVGMSGVTMEGLPGDPVSNEKGFYTAIVDYGWSGTVTPVKEGCIFEPPKRTYTKITADQPDDYTTKLLTFTVSGTVTFDGLPLSDVVINGLPVNPVTDKNGYYTGVVNYGWNGAVTPTKRGYTFKPANATYESVIAPKTQNYTATLLTCTVSGKITCKGLPIAGVVLEGLPGKPVTTKDGRYIATVNYGWSGTVTPIKEGYTFDTARRQYANVIGSQSEQNYTGKLLTYTISGMVTLGQMGLEGVQVSANNGAASSRTNAKGHYSITVPYGWSGTVTPVKNGYTFDMTKQKYVDVTGSQADQNYAAELLKYTISGRITSGGKPIEGVSVLADNGGGTSKTDAAGKYEILVNHGWSGTVKPIKEGYTFDAAKRRYTNISADKNEQNYEATLRTFTISGTIVIGGEPIEGVSMTSDNSGGSDTTNAQGRYSVTVPYGWSGTVTPTKAGYRFDPPTKRYLNVTSDIDEDKAGKEAERKAAERKAAERRAAIDEDKAGKEAERKAAERRAAERRAAERRAAEQRTAEQEAAEREAAEREAVERRAVEQETAEPEAVERKVPEEPIVEEPIAEESAKVTEQRLISNIFIDTELRQVLQDISSQAGVTIIPDQTVTGLITCELREVPLEKALEIVLAGTGYVVKKTPDYYLVSSPDPKEMAFPASSKTKFIKMNYIGAEDAVKLLSPVFKKYIQASTTTSTVIITAPPALIDRIESDLKLIDQPPKHVLLDARFVVMQSDDLLNIGVEWTWPRIKAGVFSKSELHGGGAPEVGGKWPWGIQIGYATGPEFTNALELKLNLLEANGEATIISSPQVMAQDGKQAEIKVITEEYFSLLPEYEEGRGYYYQRAELQKIQYGTILKITPHIGEQGNITLDLSVEVSDVVMRKEDDYPVVTRRNVTNTMRIKDGGTVSVAGLKKSETYLTERKVPGLGGLPILGGLFRDKRKEESTEQVAVFITAHLIPESTLGARTPEPSPAEQEQVPDEGEPTDNDFKKALEKSLLLPNNK